MQALLVKWVLKRVLFGQDGGIYEVSNVDSKDYDQTFPKPVSLSESRIGWVVWDVYLWIEPKMEERE